MYIKICYEKHRALYTLLEYNISISEFSQLNIIFPLFASPDVDWYNITPHLNISPLFPTPLYSKSELSLIFSVLLPLTIIYWVLFEVL